MWVLPHCVKAPQCKSRPSVVFGGAPGAGRGAPDSLYPHLLITACVFPSASPSPWAFCLEALGGLGEAGQHPVRAIRPHAPPAPWAAAHTRASDTQSPTEKKQRASLQFDGFGTSPSCTCTGRDDVHVPARAPWTVSETLRSGGQGTGALGSSAPFGEENVHSCSNSRFVCGQELWGPVS